MYNYPKTRLACFFVVLVSLATAQQIHAADVVLEEIIVTAQKREQRLQDVPLAITALSGDFLEVSKIENVGGLVDFVPGLNGAAVGEQFPHLHVRGIGTSDFGVGSDPAAAVFVDGVYYGRIENVITDLLDIERVEVLKGPQGTLFGRNTSAGAISIITRKPDEEFGGKGHLSYGEFDHITARGILNVPVTDNLFMRVAASSSTRDGYFENTLGEKDLWEKESFSTRFSTRYVGFENVDIVVSAQYLRDRGSPPPLKSLDPTRSPYAAIDPDPFGNFATDGGDASREDRDKWDVAATITADLDRVTLTSITSYSGYNIDFREDTDGREFKILHFATDREHDAFGQELRIASSTDRLDWFIGASVFSEKIDSVTNFNYDETFFGIGPDTDFDELSFNTTEVDSYAVFGDATFSATDKLNFSFGLRASLDRKRATLNIPLDVRGFNIFLGETDGQQTQAEDWDSVTPRIAVDYRWSDGLMTYFSFARGFKAGAFDEFAISPAVRPEKMKNYEIGAKSAPPGGRVAIDVAAFFYTYDDYQDFGALPGGVFVPELRNAASVEGYGLEVELTAALTENFDVRGTLGLLTAEFDEYVDAEGDFSGNTLPRAPEVTASLLANYSQPLSGSKNLTFRGEYVFTSEQFFARENSNHARQDDYSLVNGRIGLDFTESGVSIGIFARNMLDEEYLIGAPDSSSRVVPAPPRTWGIELEKRF